jgi:hypothetical protein
MLVRSAELVFVVVAWLGAVPILGAVRAHAQASLNEPPSAEPAGYRELVNEAVAEFGLHHFAEARALFARAHELSPSARTLRGLGASEFELRNYSDCVSYLEQALASSIKPLDPALRERTERLLERARSFVGRVQLSVQPASSVALIDGVPVRAAKEVTLGVGDHVIELQAEGYIPERRTLRVNGGESKTIHIALTIRIGAPAAPHDDASHRPLLKNPWLWTGVVAVAAGTALGVGLALRGRDASPDDGTAHVVVGR